MPLWLIALIVGLPVVLLVFSAGFAYVDAPEYGMNPRKWAVISFLIPFFGFFAYLFERDERTPDPDRDMYTDGVFEIHESRADDTRLARGGREADSSKAEENDEDTGEYSRDPADQWDR